MEPRGGGKQAVERGRRPRIAALDIPMATFCARRIDGA